jgi:hypothetical protein
MRVFKTERIPNLISRTVPPGVLKPSQIYRYLIRVLDSTGWVEIQNRSDRDWVTLKMGDTLKCQFRLEAIGSSSGDTLQMIDSDGDTGLLFWGIQENEEKLSSTTTKVGDPLSLATGAGPTSI